MPGGASGCSQTLQHCRLLCNEHQHVWNQDKALDLLALTATLLLTRPPEAFNQTSRSIPNEVRDAKSAKFSSSDSLPPASRANASPVLAWLLLTRGEAYWEAHGSHLLHLLCHDLVAIRRLLLMNGAERTSWQPKPRRMWEEPGAIISISVAVSLA